MTLLADFAACLGEFAEPVQVRRPLPVVLEDGRVQPAPDAELFDIYASVQPTPTKEQQELPEGMRNRGAINVYTEFPLRTVSTAEARAEDVVVVKGVEYQVAKIDDWLSTANYIKAVCVRIPT